MRLTVLLFSLLPLSAFAVGDEDYDPPTPSETTTICEDGEIFDLATKTCMDPAESTNDDSAKLGDVRELAYDGAFQAALEVLDTLDDPQDPRALTYYGFAHRKTGNVALGMSYYNAALRADPDNILARSYMGQAFAEAGQTERAQEQLSEIRIRGGRGTWPEFALRQAIATGRGYSY